MELPFPGMDPFLEASSLWPDVHNSLIYTFRDQIQRQLNPNYVAVITPYVTFENLQIAPARRAAIPDVGVLDSDPSGGYATTPTGAVAIEPAPLTLPVEIDVPTRYERRIDYRNEPPPPPLSPQDAAWLDEQLRARGLRD